jgi:predicted nicotinamide N-methyase
MSGEAREPELIETPAEALGPTVREEVLVGNRTFLIERPDAVDPLSDHPTLGGASATQEYKPYWASIWPAAQVLAWALDEYFDLLGWTTFRHHWALEVGCGLGLPGIVALSRGVHVTFSDYDATALRYAASNARLNGFHNFDVLHMDWRSPPVGWQTDLLLASEPIYVMDQVESLARFVSDVLAPEGCFLMADNGRSQAEALRHGLAARGMTIFNQRTATYGDGDELTGVVCQIYHKT